MHHIEGTETPAERRRRIWSENLNASLALSGSATEPAMTPKQFHVELVDAGMTVTMQAVYMWLNGDTAPSMENQLLIARVLRTPVHLLFPLDVARDAA